MKGRRTTANEDYEWQGESIKAGAGQRDRLGRLFDVAGRQARQLTTDAAGELEQISIGLASCSDTAARPSLLFDTAVSAAAPNEARLSVSMSSDQEANSYSLASMPMTPPLTTAVPMPVRILHHGL
eukprot:TRINITY_DN28794_c0_g1_i1.p1 TRINITY_DN28794_c0_g1~~TRINITY_DN28794_c0_g1_i1.p1  ORF type:complete len:126 (-),score=12.66 TRINITY_DN28794_c0_g1_i1:237-614(-)